MDQQPHEIDATWWTMRVAQIDVIATAGSTHERLIRGTGTYSSGFVTTLWHLDSSLNISILFLSIQYHVTYRSSESYGLSQSHQGCEISVMVTVAKPMMQNIAEVRSEDMVYRQGRMRGRRRRCLYLGFGIKCHVRKHRGEKGEISILHCGIG